MDYKAFTDRYDFDPASNLLGEGGFGEVYRAYDTLLDKFVAIKRSRVKPDQEHFSLLREVELAKKLPVHANIARYEDCFRISIPLAGTFDFAVLQYYEEGNLSRLIQSGKLNKSNLMVLVKGILSGVDHLHRNNVIHRDLKPSNILIAKRENVFIPKISDFGISKQGEKEIGVSQISNSVAGGSFLYASPEQIMGETKLHRNSDLWSFGVILYQILSNKLPFDSDSMNRNSEASRSEITKKILKGIIPADINNFEIHFREIIRKCLVVDTEKRAKSADEIFSLLDGLSVDTSNSDNTFPVINGNEIFVNASEGTICDTAEVDMWHKAHESGSKQSFEEYIKKYPEGKFKDEAVKVIEEFDWLDALKTNTIEGFQNFIKNFPDSHHGKDLEKHYSEINEEIAWKSISLSQNVSDVASFIATYSDGKFIKQALAKQEQLVWNRIGKGRDIDLLKKYLHEYKSGQFEAEAKKLLQELEDERRNNIFLEAKKNKDINKIYQYINENPTGNNVDEAKILYDDLFWEDCKKSGTVVSFRLYVRSFPQGRHLTEANEKIAVLKAEEQTQILDEWNDIKDGKDAQVFRGFISKYPDSEYVSVAQEKIKEIEKRLSTKVAIAYFLVFAVVIILIIAFNIRLGENKTSNSTSSQSTYSETESEGTNENTQAENITPDNSSQAATEIPESTNSNERTLAIGANYAGGIVFYIDNVNKFGLVVCEEFLFEKWGCIGNKIGTTASNFGSGTSNTNSILENCGRNTAAGVCENLNYNGYSDWYLPSKEEWSLLYSSVIKNGIGTWSGYKCWTSSEYDKNSAWIQNTSDGTQVPYNKDLRKNILAIRKFYL